LEESQKLDGSGSYVTFSLEKRDCVIHLEALCAVSHRMVLMGWYRWKEDRWVGGQVARGDMY